MRNNSLRNEINAKMNKLERIAIKEVNFDRAGHDRIVHVYLTPDENNIIRVKCEVDNTFDCWHTKFAWTLPDIQEKVQRKYDILTAGGRLNEQ